ncbi:TraI [Klebsiella pneumoniae]|nr:TraI [Klebsiella pneumoniae]
MWPLPAFDRNGRSAGIWLNPLTTDDGNGLRGFSGEGRVKGRGDAQFVALQGSRNGESLLADNMQEGVRIARDNPDSGVVVRIAGEGRPWNPGAITGGRVWGDIPDSSVQPGAGNGEPVTAEVLAQRRLKRPSAVKQNVAQMKLSVKWQRTNLTCRMAEQSRLSGRLPGRERDRAAITEREAALPESVLRESQREREAVREVAGKICCRSVCSRWSGIWSVTCRKRKPWAETDTGRQTLMTTDNTNTTRNDSLAARTDTWLQVISGLVTRTAGYHQNGGTGADGTGPHQSDIPAEAGMDVSGRARSLSAVCPGVGAESVPSCEYPATGH